MSLIKGKQLDQLFDVRISVSGFTTSAASSDVVTATVTTALGSAARDGSSVPLQVGSGIQGGVITSGTNKVEIWDGTTDLKLTDLLGNEIYGRMTEAAGVYTLSYYTNVAGTETTFTFLGATGITYAFTYRFVFGDVPFDAWIRINNISVNNDGGGGGGAREIEALTITALNTVNDLTKTPSGTVVIYVNGQAIHEGSDFTRATKVLTIVPATLGYDLETTDIAVASYPTFE